MLPINPTPRLYHISIPWVTCEAVTGVKGTPIEGYYNTCWLMELWSTKTKVEGIVLMAAWHWGSSGKPPIMGRFPNMETCIISYQEVLCSVLKNVNHYTYEFINCNYRINGQFLKNSVLAGCLCFGAL
jgi:hypothetical protein